MQRARRDTRESRGPEGGVVSTLVRAVTVFARRPEDLPRIVSTRGWREADREKDPVAGAYPERPTYAVVVPARQAEKPAGCGAGGVDHPLEVYLVCGAFEVREDVYVSWSGPYEEHSGT
jgi:hypothetical protein